MKPPLTLKKYKAISYIFIQNIFCKTLIFCVYYLVLSIGDVEFSDNNKYYFKQSYVNMQHKCTK